MKLKTGSLVALAATLVSVPALAAPAADLGVSISAPSGVNVYNAATYTFTVGNTGNRNASNVTLTIQLPETNTSPQVYVMGVVNSLSAGCTRTGTVVTCNLGTINKGTSKSSTVNITLPYSTDPIVFDASASTTTNEENFANNSASHTASLGLYSVAVSAPENATNRHCTGTGLSSFFECELFPSSISSFDSVLETDGSVTLIGADPGLSGDWTLIGSDYLHIEYYDGVDLAGTLDARGVSADCFEGPMVFPGSSYIAMYEVCLQ